MEGSPGIRVEIRYPYSGFSPNPKNKFFLSYGTYYPRVGTNKFERCNEKNLFVFPEYVQRLKGVKSIPCSLLIWLPNPTAYHIIVMTYQKARLFVRPKLIILHL